MNFSNSLPIYSKISPIGARVTESAKLLEAGDGREVRA